MFHIKINCLVRVELILLCSPHSHWDFNGPHCKLMKFVVFWGIASCIFNLWPLFVAVNGLDHMCHCVILIWQQCYIHLCSLGLVKSLDH